MMIAVPTGEGIVEEQFEGCERFFLFALASDYSIESVADYKTPGNGSSTADVATALARLGVTHVLVKHVKTDTVHMLHTRRVCVVRGAQGAVTDVVDSFIKGLLIDSPLSEETAKFQAAS